MIKALNTTGKAIATNKYLENMIPIHASKVASVPKGTSSGAVGEKQFAIRQPNVNPIACFLLKKQEVFQRPAFFANLKKMILIENYSVVYDFGTVFQHVEQRTQFLSAFHFHLCRT